MKEKEERKEGKEEERKDDTYPLLLEIVLSNLQL